MSAQSESRSVTYSQTRSAPESPSARLLVARTAVGRLVCSWRRGYGLVMVAASQYACVRASSSCSVTSRVVFPCRISVLAAALTAGMARGAPCRCSDRVGGGVPARGDRRPERAGWPGTGSRATAHADVNELYKMVASVQPGFSGIPCAWRRSRRHRRYRHDLGFGFTGIFCFYIPGPVVGAWRSCRACSSAGLDTPVQSWANSP